MVHATYRRNVDLKSERATVDMHRKFPAGAAMLYMYL